MSLFSAKVEHKIEERKPEHKVARKQEQKPEEKAEHRIISEINIELLKTYELFPEFFPQINKLLPKDFRLNDYFRSLSLFQEVTTLAIFDILPICNLLFPYYHTHKLVSEGYSITKAKQYLSQLQEKLKGLPTREVVIFLLTDIKTGNDVGLECPSSPWRIHLKIRQTAYSPRKIELIHSDKTLESILHNKFHKLKKIYKLTFCLPNTYTTKRKIQTLYKLYFQYLDLWGEVLLPSLIFCE